MNPLIWDTLTILISVAASTVTVVNYLNRKFAHSEISDIRLDGRIETLAFKIESNTKLIDSRSDTFSSQISANAVRLEETILHYHDLSKEYQTRTQQGIEHLTEDNRRTSDKLASRISQVENYLAKSGFIIRR